MRRLFAQFDPRIENELYEQRGPIYKGLLCSAGAAALISLTGLLVKYLLVAISERSYSLLTYMSLGVIVLFGIKYFLTRGQSYFLSEAATRMTQNIRQALFARLLRLPVTYFNEKRAGAIQSVLANDVMVYQNAVVALKDSIDGPIKVAIGFVVIVLIQWKLTLAAMLVLPFMVLFIQRNARKMKVAQAEVQENLGHVTAFMNESLQGTRIVKAFGAEEVTDRKFAQHSDALLAAQLKAARRVATLKPMVEFIGAVALGIVVYLCGVLASRGELGAADLGGFVITLDAINRGIQSIGSLKQTKAQVQAASDRIYTEVMSVTAEDTATAGRLVPSTSRGEIEFRDVSFTYPDGTEALRSVSFVIRPGESLALVGNSGAGKSTIADLLMRFYDPTSGVILYDGTDVRELDTDWYRRQIGVVPQTNFLFAGSISENIQMAAPEASAADIREATVAAHASGFIDEMPNGIETQLGERGVRLSGGQAQRIAIARALIRKPKILLLDEATSNLDAVSEKAVTEALDEIMPGRTTLLIAHRLTTAARATRIVVLRKGEIIEQGPFRALLDAQGPFAHMYESFLAGSES
ncbi:MAG: ABC transporter ATP-binding protein [Chthonomonas sp.]|nr:ABC transporter ATP-binding protein [Chthonomonas sp.]